MRLLRISLWFVLAAAASQTGSGSISGSDVTIYLAPPNAFGWIVPYAGVGLGLVVIWLFIRKYRKPAPLPEIGTMEIDDPELEKYRDQIEKDLAKLE